MNLEALYRLHGGIPREAPGSGYVCYLARKAAAA
jgi:hypothetical protein